MPQKLTVSDYTFYFVPEGAGRYRYKGIHGHIFRKPNDEFAKIMDLAVKLEKGSIIKLFGITNIQIIRTGEYTLVYDLFADLREEKSEDDCCRD